MGKKKGKGNKPTSKRGHNESSVNRYRQVTALIPVNRDNEPISVPRKQLAKAMLDVTGSKTTRAEQATSPPEPKQPKNVVSLCERRNAANNVEYSASSEAKATINYERLLYHGWSENSDKVYVSESERNARELHDLIERSAAHPNGKNAVEGKDERIAAHAARVSARKAEVKAQKATAKKQKPISMVHNPGVSSIAITHTPDAKPSLTQIERAEWYRKFGDMSARSPGKTPSGRLIREFTEGKYAPPETQQSTEVPRSKDWGVVQDKYKPKGLVAVPNAWSAEDQLLTMMSIVDEELWPAQIKPYVFNDNGTWRIHTGKVRASVRDQEDRTISRAVALAMINHVKEFDGELAALTAENQFLLQENKLLSYELAHYTGDKESKEELAKEIGQLKDWTPQGSRQTAREISNNFLSATEYAKPPEITKLVAEFKLFNAFVDSNGTNEAYSRFKYGSPDAANAVEAECQRRIKERNAEVQGKMQSLRLRSLTRQVPLLIKLTKEHDFMQRLSKANNGKDREFNLLRSMHKRNHAKPTNQTMYLSGLIIHQTNRFCSDFKITMNGKRVLTDVVEITCTPPVTRLKEPPVNYLRIINKVCTVMSLATYRQCKPTVMLLSNDRGDVYEYDSPRMRRWEKWFPLCEGRDIDRQQAELEQAEVEVSQRREEHHREVMRKPLNRAINKLSQGVKKLWDIGQTEVYVSKKELAQREENKRICRERTENEIREQNKLEEKAKQDEIRREERRERNRAYKARKKAEKAKAAELRAAKEAAKAAYRKVN